MSHHCVDGAVPGPLPWKIVRSPIPYFTWIMDGTGGVVCLGFGAADEQVLLHAHDLLNACEALLAANDPTIVGVEAVAAIIAAIRRTA